MKKPIAYCGLDCEGCRADGAKTPYCDSLCPIRQCALAKGNETCGECPALDGYQKVGMMLTDNAEPRKTSRPGKMTSMGETLQFDDRAQFRT